MAEQAKWQMRDPYGEKILLSKFDWRDERVISWIDKVCEFGWRDSMGNLTRQKAKQTGALMRSLKWRTWGDSGGDRQVWQARYLYYAKFVELALGRNMPFVQLPPDIPGAKWQPIEMPDRPRKAKPSIPTEMRRQKTKFVTMLEERFSFAGIAMIAYALGPSIENRRMIRRLMFQTKGTKANRQVR